MLADETRQEELTVHETQLVIDKTQHDVHDGAELWGEKARRPGDRAWAAEDTYE